LIKIQGLIEYRGPMAYISIILLFVFIFGVPWVKKNETSGGTQKPGLPNTDIGVGGVGHGVMGGGGGIGVWGRSGLGVWGVLGIPPLWSAHVLTLDLPRA
jgi:hypothetical protein